MRAVLTGAIELRSSDGSLLCEIRGDAARILFAQLALAYPHPVSTGHLAFGIWSDEIPTSWSASLRNAISRLRSQLSPFASGDAVVSSDGGYHLNFSSPISVDFVDARKLLDGHGGAHDNSEALETAVRTLRAEFAPGAEGEWVDNTRLVATAALHHGLERLVEALIGSANFSMAVATAEEAIARDPLRETARQALLRCHLASGARSDGLRAYEVWRAHIGEELGVPPSRETEDLYLQLLGLGEMPRSASAPRSSGPGDFEPRAVSGRASFEPGALNRRCPIPVAPGPLVGRDLEVDAVIGALALDRIVSLTGIGGMGKSRVAGQVAQQLSAAQLVAWIDLSSSTSSFELFENAVVDQLCGPTNLGNGTKEAQLAASIADSHCVVVLDCCERIRDPQSLVRLLLGAGPNIKIFAVGRHPMRVENERRISLGPLPTSSRSSRLLSSPDTVVGSPAAELFLTESSRNGALTDHWSLADIEDLCAQIDGIPLAVVLAASRTKSLVPREIAGHLSRSLDLLNDADGRGTDAGKESNPSPGGKGLSAAIEWSYALLTPFAQEVLARLSVFAAEFDTDAAVHVVSLCLAERLETQHELGTTFAALDAIEELLAAGLVRSRTTGPAVRLSLMQTIRFFADRELETGKGSRQARMAHAEHYRSVVAASRLAIVGSDEKLWVERLNAAMPEIVLAHGHLLASGELEKALAMGIDLVGYGFYRLRRSVAKIVTDSVLSDDAHLCPSFALACAAASLLSWMVGDGETANRFLGLAEATQADGWLFNQAAGTIAVYRGDLNGAAKHYRSSVAAASVDQYFEQAIALSQVAFLAAFLSEPDALELALSSQVFADRSGSPTALANASWALGIVLMDRDPDGAKEHFEQCRANAETVDAYLSIGAADAPLAMLAGRSEPASNRKQADALLDQLRYWRNAEHSPQFWLVARQTVVLLTRVVRMRQAATILGASKVATLQFPLPRKESARLDVAIATIEATLGSDLFALLVQQGGALDVVRCAELVERELVLIAEGQ